MTTATKLLAIALAGALGTLARYGLAGLVQRKLPAWAAAFPFGTAIVNIIGCFFFGLLLSALTQRWSISPELRAAILVGFMGAFTTFSTYIFESRQLLADSEWILAFANLTGQILIGLAALLTGMALGKAL